VPKLDPRAISESLDGRLPQWSGARKDFEIAFSKVVTYEDGTKALTGVRIVTKNRDGRDVVVTAPEARTGKDEKTYELLGGVTLRDSTGFELATERCEYREDGVVRAAGQVDFSKGRMRGGGVGMAFGLNDDVLRVEDRAWIDVAASQNSEPMRFTAGSTTFDRQRDRLTLERDVHAVRGRQVTTAERATAHLSADEDVITFVELRGRAGVDGEAGAVEAMRARDIDLDYTDDGATLERALLMGAASVTLRGRAGVTGRQVAAERLESVLASDGALKRLTAEQQVVMSLPADAKGPARSIRSGALEASGAADGSLTGSRFSGGVVFEEAASGKARPRVARSKALTLEMAADDIAGAVFAGGAVFEEDDLRASSAEARYEPGSARLRLSGIEGGLLPTVSDRRLRVEAQTIDVGLERRTLDARGRVKTFLNRATASPSDKGQPSSRLPGLFAQDQAANVTAARLVHDGEGGSARFSGDVWLWQGEREIRAGVIEINDTTGDLLAIGAARSRLIFESGQSEGEAHEIRYTDSLRVITYCSTHASAARCPPSSPAETRRPDVAGSRLNGKQGDLSGRRIDVVLDKAESRVDRIEAYEDVTAKVDAKTITGHRLTYHQSTDRYEVVGTPAAPVKLRTESCEENVGNTLIFDRSTDTMTVKGQGGRVQTKNTCRTPSSR
jgi:lipopolysaccharide export system protein LptA